MQILDFLTVDAIKMSLESKNKKDAIKELVELLIKSGKVKDKKKMVQTLMEREELGSTGIGQGIAIPHGKSDTVGDLAAAFALSADGISFDSLDGEPVNIFFLLVAPEGAAGAHLKDKYFRKSLLTAKTAEDVIKIIQEEEKLKH